jgi:phosphoribosylformylglycinamidine synthase subunit PurS
VRFVAHVEISLKPGLLDPQGAAVEGALPALGWTNVGQVRVGKYVRLELESSDRDAAVEQVKEMAERLLSNPVIETFAIRAVSEHAGATLEDRPA